MALNTNLYRELLNTGVSHKAALVLADPERDVVSGGPVSNPAALTVIGTMPGTYTQANEQQLRNDLAALRSTVDTLVTALKNAGVIS